jgi:hypothetical protein
MERTIGMKSFDPPSGVRVDGRKRGRNAATYDYMIQGRRIEVKSAQLRGNTSSKCWVVEWQNIKRNEYDDLLLVLYTPSGLYIFLHDDNYGVTTTGKSQHACGGKVQVYGTRNEPSISAATDAIRAKMASMHYATVGFSEFKDLVTTTTTHDAYDGVPLASHSSSARGDILERVARRVMEKAMGLKSFDPTPGVRVNGTKRGRKSETYDFMIGGRRVEIKNSQLVWNTTSNRWWAMWQNIKRDEYDDLILVLYTPSAIHIFMHDHVYGVTTHGKSQCASGGGVCVHAPCNEPSISAATDAILKKMEHMQYASLAYS